MKIDLIQQEVQPKTIELENTATVQKLLEVVASSLNLQRGDFRMIHKGKILSQQQPNL